MVKYTPASTVDANTSFHFNNNVSEQPFKTKAMNINP